MPKGLLLGLFAVLSIGLAYPADADPASPLLQARNGVPADEIQCKLGMIPAESPAGRLACLSEGTAGMLKFRGWQVVEQHTSKDHPASATHETFDAGNLETPTKTVTLTSGPFDPVLGADVSHSQYMPNQRPWSTLTYPEEFLVGEPFVVNYTWTFYKFYSEANGDEWSDDLER